jgi:hypothetical protein
MCSNPQTIFAFNVGDADILRKFFKTFILKFKVLQYKI